MPPKITWAQDRRSIHLSFPFPSSFSGSSTAVRPSVCLTNDSRRVVVQCPELTETGADICLDVLEPVFPIQAEHQIKVFARYVRIVLFKRKRRSWERLTGSSSAARGKQAVDDDDGATPSSRRAVVIAPGQVAYDWDLDEVLQRQMEEALDQAGLDDSYSDESGEGDEERDAAAVTGKNKKASLDRCASGYDQDGESSDAVAVGDRSRDRKQQQPTKKRRVRRDSTSSSSSPSSSSDSNGSDNDAGKGEKQKPATQPRSENSPPKPQPKAQPARPAAANARNASPPVEPPGARHTLSDRQVLFLVVVVGVVCATIGAALAGFLVFRAMDSKLAALLLAQQQQQAPAGAAKGVVGDL